MFSYVWHLFETLRSKVRGSPTPEDDKEKSKPPNELEGELGIQKSPHEEPSVPKNVLYQKFIPTLATIPEEDETEYEVLSAHDPSPKSQFSVIDYIEKHGCNYCPNKTLAYTDKGFVCRKCCRVIKFVHMHKYM